MGLDTRFVPLFTLQEYFVDKTNAQALSNGIVDFYQDNSRSVPKQVYKLQSTGSPPVYNYVAIGTQLILSSYGTFLDPNTGADIAPYLFPYDGNVSTTTNTLELYYITVTDANGAPQFVREGVPNLADGGSSSGAQTINYAANGQFLLHNDNSPVPNTNDQIAYGGTVGNVYATAVAPGGWFFERSTTSTATDVVTFSRNASYNSNINEPGNPRYNLNVQRSVGSNDAVCQVSLRFMDVNKFSGQTMTLLFTAFLNSGTSLSNVLVNEIQYYGSGSATTTIVTAQNSGNPITITSSITQFAVPIVFNINNSGTVGDNDDDFVELAISLPANQTWNVSFTDFVLALGTVSGSGLSQFPITTNGQFVLEALSNLMQTTNAAGSAYYPEDGSNYYLPMVMTPKGATYDYSVVGTITSAIYTAANAANFPLVLCNGQPLNPTQYTNLGVPYSRLQSVLIANSPVPNTPMYGTGSDYATAYTFSGLANSLRLTVNSSGNAAAAATVGTTSFTITSMDTPLTATGNISLNAVNTNNLTLEVLGIGFSAANAASAAGTSGFTVQDNNYATGLYAQQFYSFVIQTVAATSLAGTYFRFSNSTTDYYMWFTVDGAGANPSGANAGRTGIQLNLLSTYTAQDVANCVREAINQMRMSSIVINSAPTGGQYFTFQVNPATPANFYAWYFVDGAGGDPAPGGQGIKVSINSADSTALIATKTLTAINAFRFAVPDFRGMFLRGLDPASTWDLDAGERWSIVTGLSGANLGTFEYQQFLSHTHISTPHIISDDGGSNGSVGSGNNNAAQGTFTIINQAAGGTETRPVNAAVNFYIHY